MTSPASNRPVPPRRRIPRSFKDLTPSKHFNPRTFFQELILKGWFTPRHGEYRRPIYPRLKHGQIAITWIGHASFLIQFNDLNVLVDPNFANWLFLLKRIKRAGLKIRDLPPIDLILLTHHHADHIAGWPHRLAQRQAGRTIAAADIQHALARPRVRQRQARHGDIRHIAVHIGLMLGPFLAGGAVPEIDLGLVHAHGAHFFAAIS